MAKTVTTHEVKELIDGDEKYYLIDVLSPDSYEARHIPTAINMPVGPNMIDKLEELGASKDDKIIVYCSSSSCGASPAAAEALEKAGYSNVAHYKYGLAGWKEAGYEFAN